MTLTFVTSNRHKFGEAERIAAKHGVELEHRDVPYIEIQADELEEIARPSAQQASALLRAPCFVEDAGLFIHALKGFPGPYSSYVFQTLGNEGILELMKGKKVRRAEFRSAVAYCEPGSRPIVFSGGARGTIAPEIRGEGGFGFDPIFVPQEGDGMTFAEISIDEKNKFSHRSRAIERFVKWYVEDKKV
ncbi:MAG: XTP/dITP diphosphatase [Candidatus Hadarchaeota archaeon]|nr:XTP/dITP diphosphatase [Candidatus Hadarchaeota archaeon]